MIGIGVGIPFNKGIQRAKYLLDKDFAQGATAAYALRLLREKHSGGIIRCRADDAGTSKGEADVLPILQPDGSKIITLNSPIENFSGTPFSGDGYVLADLVDAGNGNYDGLTSSWYDQTPNLNDASNSTASEQPQIVSGGSVIQKNGKPALNFNGNNSLEAITNAYSQPFTSILVSSIDSLNGNNEYFVSTNNNGTVLFKNKSNFNVWNGSQITGKRTTKDQVLYWFLSNSPNSEFYLSGVLQGKEDTKNGNFKNIAFGGQYGDNKNYINGKIQEFIFYKSNKSSNKNKIETNINNFYSIF